MEEKLLIKSSPESKVIHAIVGIMVFVLIILIGGEVSMNTEEMLMFGFAPGIIFLILYFFVYLRLLNKVYITVTNKKATGRSLFGKQVDLPIDSISSVAIVGLFKGIVVSTSSGRISFYS